MDEPAKAYIRTSSNRSKKACTECRQQKAKCDAYLNPGRPCSRCCKVKTRCVISDPFKREHKRKRLSELEHEAGELRQKLRTSESSISHESSIAVMTSTAEASICIGNVTSSSLTASPQGSRPYFGPASSQIDVIPPSVPPDVLYQRLDPGERAVPRTLNGIRVEGDEIDDIFRLFFKDYAHFVPVIDPATNPNTCYSQSNLLFWAIIGVACRSYLKNPTLLNALSEGIMNSVLLSMGSNSSPLYKIQALLLLLTWPLPRMDTLYSFSGFLLHMAMHNGLHIPMSSHEFSRMRVGALSEADITKRSEIWIQCLLVYQRTSLCKGQPGQTLTDLVQDSWQRQTIWARVSREIGLELKCAEIALRCCSAVLENGVRNMVPEQERSLTIILRVFEHQVDDLDTHEVSDTGRFYMTVCRLNIQVLYFYKSFSGAYDNCLAGLFTNACTAINYIDKLGEKPGFLAAAPFYYLVAVLLAAFSLLRLLKSSVSETLDTEKARLSMFKGINLAKRMSTDTNDIAARCALALNQLWTSPKAFRKPDGSEYTTLRIRSRLSVSPVLDALRWWREEFDPQQKPPAVQGDTLDGPDANRDNHLGPILQDLPGISPQRPESLHYLHDEFLAEFEWALDNDGLLAATGHYQ